MTDLLAELATACAAATATPDREKVSEGESMWLAGQPVATEQGYIGLSMGDGHAVIVSAGSVREVEKENGRYLVRIPVGTPALVRSEAVTTLRKPSHECGCSHSSADAVARTAGGGNTGTGPVIIQCPLVCRVEPVCSLVLTNKGRILEICVPMLSCRRECPSQPA
jgi:hypothetical protein